MPRVDLSADRLRSLDLEVVEPGLWRAGGPGVGELAAEAGLELPPGSHLWLVLEEGAEVPDPAPALEVTASLGLACPPGLEALLAHPPPPELPGEYRLEEGRVEYRPREGDAGEGGGPPLPGAVRVGNLEGEGPWVLEPVLCYRFRVEDRWPVELEYDPWRSRYADPACPACSGAVDRWYLCERHGPHCSADRRVCRACRRGACAACFECACGHCGQALCPECAAVPCALGGFRDGSPSPTGQGFARGQHGACPEHRAECGDCHRTVCLKCLAGECRMGGDPLCLACAGKCSGCGAGVRARLLIPCHDCSRVVCPDCAQTCHLSGRVMCREHARICPTCSRPISSAHRRECPACGRELCRMHLEPCATCGQPTCAECLERGRCLLCLGLESLSADSPLARRLASLAEGRPWAGARRLETAEGPSRRLFRIPAGSAEYRVVTDREVTRLLFEHRRGFLDRLLRR